jgi:hypothetical protein
MRAVHAQGLSFQIPGIVPENEPFTRPGRRLSIFVDELLTDRLRFYPGVPRSGRAPGGDALDLDIPERRISVDVDATTEERAMKALQAGALPRAVVELILKDLGVEASVIAPHLPPPGAAPDPVLASEAATQLGTAAVEVAQRVHEALFDVEPLSDLEFRASDRAKLVLALGWEAIVRLGRFPIQPHGSERMQRISARPCGAFHFVSASDLDRGFYYTLGIAQSPEAQAQQSLDVPFGLDGELIIPGQAVSPIPPLLALATRLFASGIPTSSNISEEQHSIPARAFPHPKAYHDLEPVRPGQTGRRPSTGNILEAIDDVLGQLQQSDGRFEVDAVLDVTGLDDVEADGTARAVLSHRAIRETSAELEHRLKELERGRKTRIALFLNVQQVADRVKATEKVIDLAQRLKLQYVGVCSDDENPMLPNLNEYFTAEQLNHIADYADARDVCVVDARPLDPEYTAATACQRIQSVMSTLAVDILKLGMWLCLDAHSARHVWQLIRTTPAFASQMVLMPIGIVEPWSAFIDNRREGKTGRAIADPFEKVRFMIEEAAKLGMPSLLTDTRHKETWLLLGAKSGDTDPHPREMGHVTSLLSWNEFMQCERLARHNGIFLGQAGSVEMSQMFRVISETTLDAAREGRNPATAIWTAETERVIRKPKTQTTAIALQRERSADVSPFLAVVNRAEESHARLDGWIRFLEEWQASDRGRVSPLAALRERLTGLYQGVLTAQDILVLAEEDIARGSKDLDRVRRCWVEYRRKFLEYHRTIRENFLQIRDQVEAAWGSMAKKPAKP